MNDIHFYLPEEVAKMLRCHTETVRNLARAGKLRGVKVGDLWRFTDQNIMDFVKREGRRQ